MENEQNESETKRASKTKTGTKQVQIEIPDSVDVNIEWPFIRVKGPNGEVEREFKGPLIRYINLEKNGNVVVVKSLSKRRKVNALFGTVCSHMKNLIAGTTKGYVYKMKMFYTHFPMTIEMKGNRIFIKNFLGERTLRSASIIGKTKVDHKKDEITVTGVDKEHVSQTAANIEIACRLSRKDRRVFLDGIYITGKDVEANETVKG